MPWSDVGEILANIGADFVMSGGCSWRALLLLGCIAALGVAAFLFIGGRMGQGAFALGVAAVLALLIWVSGRIGKDELLG